MTTTTQPTASAVTIATTTAATTDIDTPALDTVIAKMDRHIAAFAQARDPRERFLLMYRTFKDRLRVSIASGRFLDARWAEAICCRMAETYFEALDHYERGAAECPQCWQRAFDDSLRGRTNLLQDALLGMNAHINFDLTIATYDTLRNFDDLQDASLAAVPDRARGRSLSRRYYDYLMINQIAWESIGAIQEALTRRFARLLGALSRLSSRPSRLFMERIIMDYRDRSWGHVLLMVSIDDDDRMRDLRSFMDLQAVRNIHRIMGLLSFNPLVFAGAALRGFPLGEVELEPERYHAVGTLLLGQLGDTATASYAHRALVQYGASAEPMLVEALRHNSLPTRTQRRLIAVLTEIGTSTAVAALIEALGVSSPSVRSVICQQLVTHGKSAGRRPVTVPVMADCLLREVHGAYTLHQAIDDLHSLVVPTLLKDALQLRLAQALMRIRCLLALRDRRSGLQAQAADPSPAPAQLATLDEHIGGALQALFAGTPLVDPAGAALAPPKRPWHEWVRHWIGGDDRWLQVAAIHAAMDLGWRRFAPETTAALEHDPTLAEDLGLTGLLDARAEATALGEAGVAELIENWSGRAKPMMSTIEKILYLKNVALFNEIPAEELTQIARLARECAFARGETLIRRGEQGRQLLILLSGEVEVRQGPVVIDTLSAGAVLGEMSLLSNIPTTADCVALAGVRTLTIDRADFITLLYGDYPEIALGLLDVLSRRLERANRKAEQGAPSG